MGLVDNDKIKPVDEIWSQRQRKHASDLNRRTGRAGIAGGDDAVRHTKLCERAIDLLEYLRAVGEDQDTRALGHRRRDDKTEDDSFSAASWQLITDTTDAVGEAGSDPLNIVM